MGRRTDFGENWHEVVAQWCSGFAPTVTEEEGWAALGVLERFWPEELDRLLTDGIRSRLVITDAVDHGLTLSACENLTGFDHVLRRLKAGDKAALSELAFAAALVKAGYVPELEPALNGRRLDALVREGNENIYIEVISPELSQPMLDAEERVRILAHDLAAITSGLITDVFLIADPSDETIRQILTFMGSPKILQATVIYEIPNVAVVKCHPFDATFEFSKENFIDRELPAIGIVAGDRRRKYPSMSMVRLPITDERAARLMEAETHHFSRDEVNILAIDVSNLPGAIRDWVPLLERRFQPTLNRRFGAIILFTRINQLHNAEIRRYYSVLRNPHAYRQPPGAFLDNISQLDEYDPAEDDEAGGANSIMH